MAFIYFWTWANPDGYEITSMNNSTKLLLEVLLNEPPSAGGVGVQNTDTSNYPKTG